ncbi:MAG: hypothetical protein IJW59_01510 [Clostridia bacterium]|nr:hypothetical protein [Clostridia bacterium]
MTNVGVKNMFTTDMFFTKGMLFGKDNIQEDEGLRENLKKAGKIALNVMVAAGATVGAIASLGTLPVTTAPIALAGALVASAGSIADATKEVLEIKEMSQEMGE